MKYTQLIALALHQLSQVLMTTCTFHNPLDIEDLHNAGDAKTNLCKLISWFMHHKMLIPLIFSPQQVVLCGYCLR